jgi:hypothetical protein
MRRKDYVTILGTRHTKKKRGSNLKENAGWEIIKMMLQMVDRIQLALIGIQ